MKIYTKKGDKGKTTIGKLKFKKSDEVIHKLGEFDETRTLANLEQQIDAMDTLLPPIEDFKRFTSPAGAYLDYARAMVRRAERYNQSSELMPVLNRLSDWMFTFARLVNEKNNGKEINWNK